MFTQEQYNTHFQSVRELYIKIELLDWNEKKIDELQGVTLDGNIDINAESDVRRTCNLNMIVLNQSYLPSSSSRIWINKKFRLYVGIKNILTDEIVWFKKGIFVMNKPSIDVSLASKTISIEGLDKMCLMNGTLDGKLASATSYKLPAGMDINAAIKTTWQQLGGETKFIFDTIGKTLPYTIEKKVGDSVYDILKAVNDLYMGWQIYYDEDGYAIYTSIKNRINDPIAWDFTDYDFRINSKTEPDFTNIYNFVQVWGKLLSNGTQVKASSENTNPNNPFSTANMYKKELPINDDKIYDNVQAQMRTDYELMIHSNLAEKVNISCVPIYMLDVNQIINFNSPEDGLVGKYLVDSISCGMKYDSQMQINAHKLYV